MSVRAEPRPGMGSAPGVEREPRPPAPVVALAALGALVAAALAAWLPLVGIGLAVACALVVLLRGVPLTTLGRVALVLAAAAAIMGPTLALPGARAAFAYRILALLIALGLSAYLLSGGAVRVPAGLGVPMALLAVWAAWSAISATWALSPTAAVRWTALLVLGGALAVGVALVMRTRRGVLWVLGVLAATFAVAVLVGVAEVLTGFRLPTSALADRTVGAFAATSFFGNQNNFATYLTLALPYLLVLPVVARDVRLRVGGVAGGLVAIVLVLLTGSKANLLAIGLILVALLLVLATDRGGRRLLATAGVLVAAVAALVVPSLQGYGPIPLPAEVTAKLSFTTLQDQVAAQSGSGAVRSSLLAEGLELVSESNGLGVGAGNAEARIRSEAGTIGAANLHNWWLEVLVTGGVVGFVLFVALYLVMLRGQLRARTAADPLLRYLGLGGGLALVGFLAGSLGPSTMIAFAPMWVTFGLCLGTIAYAAGRRAG